jgi:hypothetical protein
MKEAVPALVQRVADDVWLRVPDRIDSGCEYRIESILTITTIPLNEERGKRCG